MEFIAEDQFSATFFLLIRRIVFIVCLPCVDHRLVSLDFIAFNSVILYTMCPVTALELIKDLAVVLISYTVKSGLRIYCVCVCVCLRATKSPLKVQNGAPETDSPIKKVAKRTRQILDSDDDEAPAVKEDVVTKQQNKDVTREKVNVAGGVGSFCCRSHGNISQ